MSSYRNVLAPPAVKSPGRPPFVGALLRFAYQIARQAQIERLHERGFGDLNHALLNMMIYPHPDGVRPSELADRANMTRQAANYLLGQLEALGYIERRAKKGSSRRLVFLTKRGWDSIDVHRAAVLDVETRWANAVGQKRFDAFKETLAELVALDAKAAGGTNEQD